TETAAVVSTYPLASQALGRLRKNGVVQVPVATFLTDMSVHPLWVAEGVDLHLALHEVAAIQAAKHGATDVEICGPLVGPAFRPARSEAEVARERTRFGLPLDRPVALITAGSWGVGEVELTAREIADAGVAVPVTVCGHNDVLRQKLEQAGIGVALGWVADMPALLRASSVVVQNAGGLTSLEAMASGIPVVSYRCLPGHGVTNAAALDEAGLAAWIRSERRLGKALVEALAAGPVPAPRSAHSADRMVIALAGGVPEEPLLEVAS
ncbi:UDP-N-acetylglucosamine--N-acetylglucosamine transferase, partial [Streptomyces tateyamensis]